MNIPSKIKLSGHEIQVDFATTKSMENIGSFNNYHNLIRLEKEEETPEDNVAECFLHEIIEAIKFKNNLVIDHVHLSVLSECLFQVLRDNKLSFHEA